MNEKINVEDGVDRQGQRAVQALLTDPSAGCQSVCYRRQSRSTNSWAADDIKSGRCLIEDLPRLYLTDVQTGGRGRLGRNWNSDSGTLTFSLVVPPLDRPEAAATPVDTTDFFRLLPLAVGVAIAEAIEYQFAPLKIRLKWPNDLIVRDAKFGGILCESIPFASKADSGQSQMVIIGVGVNVGSTPQISDASESDPVTHRNASNLAAAVGRPIDRYHVLPGLIHAIRLTTDAIAYDPADLMDRFRSRCWLTGRSIAIRQPTGVVTAKCWGLAASGGLIVETAGRRDVIHAGDVQRIRVH